MRQLQKTALAVACSLILATAAQAADQPAAPAKAPFSDPLILKPSVKPAPLASAPAAAPVAQAPVAAPPVRLLPDEKIKQAKEAAKGTPALATTPKLAPPALGAVAPSPSPAAAAAPTPASSPATAAAAAAVEEPAAASEAEIEEEPSREELAAEKKKRKAREALKRPEEDEVPKIKPSDLAPVNPFIPNAPGWLQEQKAIEVQHYVHRRRLEQEADLMDLRAKIAASEASIRKSEEGDKKGGNPGQAGVGATGQMFNMPPAYTGQGDPSAGLPGMVAKAPPPPPPPAPPQLKRILGQSAVLTYDGSQYNVRAGDTLPGGYTVVRIAFAEVELKDSASAILRLTPQW